jgi:hypothetical protein
MWLTTSPGNADLEIAAMYEDCTRERDQLR